MEKSIFGELKKLPADTVFGLSNVCQADTDPKKVDLVVGAYRTDEGCPYVFKVVRQIETEMAADDKLDKEYPPQDGIKQLKPLVQKLLFGKEDSRICSMQSVGGTGALFLAASFIQQSVSSPTHMKVLLSTPTWPNHNGVFIQTGFEILQYPYWNKEKLDLDFEPMIQTLKDAPEHSVIVLHGCAHNPTGMDPTPSQWQRILEVCIAKKFIPLLDCAYQGFASGDLERDGYAIRLFAESKIEFMVAQSFAKNMGLYGERMGMLHVVTKTAEQSEVVLTHLTQVARRVYSNPPINGGRIVYRILSDPKRYAEWKDELAQVSGRIQSMRKKLRDGLVEKKTPGNWDHITTQIGMFSYTGLTAAQSDRMISQWHVYMLNGRISMAGLNPGNIQRVVDAMDDCVRHAATTS